MHSDFHWSGQNFQALHPIQIQTEKGHSMLQQNSLPLEGYRNSLLYFQTRQVVKE